MLQGSELADLHDRQFDQVVVILADRMDVSSSLELHLSTSSCMLQDFEVLDHMIVDLEEDLDHIAVGQEEDLVHILVVLGVDLIHMAVDLVVPAKRSLAKVANITQKKNHEHSLRSEVGHIDLEAVHKEAVVAVRRIDIGSVAAH